MSVGLCVLAGVVDPVQHDEGHAAAHDQEAAQEEGGGLEKEAVSHLANVQPEPLIPIFEWLFSHV